MTVFQRLDDGGLLSNTVIQSLLQRGEVGELAFIYHVFPEIFGAPEQTGISFSPNPDTAVADLITNFSNSSYNALQVEVRRRAASGILFQANYTFGKVLTDSSGTAVRFDPFLDINRPQLERARADFDLNHVFNVNFVWPLPFSRGYKWDYGRLNPLVSGWTISSIITWQSGAPLSILSSRGTLNRTARSVQNTPVTSLTKPRTRRDCQVSND